VQIEQLHKVVEVKTVIKNRVSAKQVPEVYTDLTPKEECERIEFMRAYKAEWRDRGAGRPTKKERRMIEKMKDEM
jgi:ribosome-associated heat shock protein Hsp15